MADLNLLAEIFKEKFSDKIEALTIAFNELTLEINKNHLLTIATQLRDDVELQFNLLLDVCGVDYLHYGVAEWETNEATGRGFDRGVDRAQPLRKHSFDKPRFAVVYHLLSLTLNHRCRLKVYLSEDPPIINSVVSIWPSANWFEREAFDLYGILFDKHPDLRRILTDYGFIGHPFRKDFPLSGTVEVRYDAALKRVVYEPVEIDKRVLVPKVIRDDNRYLIEDEKAHG